MRARAAFIAGAGSAAIVAVGWQLGATALAGQNTTTSPTTTSGTTAATPATINGTFHGNDYVDDEGWGNVQVDVVITEGKITDVVFVQANATKGRDRAFPILREETLAAQKAEVATVSSATFTSLAYIKSVQSALDAAGYKG